MNKMRCGADFFYMAFVRFPQLVRLSRRSQQELAVEAVILHHEVDALRRLVVRPGPATDGPSVARWIEPAPVSCSTRAVLCPTCGLP